MEYWNIGYPLILTFSLDGEKEYRRQNIDRCISGIPVSLILRLIRGNRGGEITPDRLLGGDIRVGGDNVLP